MNHPAQLDRPLQLDANRVDLDRTMGEQLATVGVAAATVAAIAGVVILRVLPLVAAWHAQLNAALGR